MMKFLFVFVFGWTLAQGQVIDFSKHNFTESQNARLDGTWEFYWDKLLAPSQFETPVGKPEIVHLPHAWMENENTRMLGKGTYRVRIKLPGLSNDQLVIYFPYVRCAAKVFINGSLTDSIGVVGEGDQYQSQLKGLLITLPREPEIDLIVQVANYEFRWGGLGSNILIGKASTIMSNLQIKNGFDIFFAGSLLAMALYLVTMYFLYREGYSFLFLALICVAVVLRSLTTESSSLFLPSLFPDVGWTPWKRVEFFSVYSVVALFPLYVSHVFPNESKRKVDLVFVAVAAMLCGITLFTPHYVYVLLLDVCHVGLLAGFVYACMLAIKALRNRNQDAKTLFFGILVAFPFIFMEILKNSALQVPIPFTHLVEFGVLSFLLFQVYVVANHYAITYQELESVVKTKTAELTESNEIKNRMLGILSHDVRGPVNMLKATLSLFNKGHLAEHELRPMTLKIESQTGNVSLLIENILLLVKSQLNGIEINLENFVLADCVEDHLKLYAMPAAEKRIELSSTIPTEMQVRADKNVVSLVMRNLISNAIKFSNEGEQVHVLARELNGLIILSITNRGKSMSTEQAQSIFKKSSHIWSEFGTGRETGSGIGLKLCREYLLKMDSDFEILATPEGATTISISLKRGS
jgi:signal transduction histidine kinase